MVCHAPMRVTSSSAAPISTASTDVSPMEPGMRPRNASIAVSPGRCPAPSAKEASHVAPETPSGLVAATHTSPESCAG